MKSGKQIDISKSSLISLKAELARKQEELQKVKGDETYIKLPPKPKPVPKINPGIEGRIRKDEEKLSTEDLDLLKKSREVLKVKTSLYEKLQSGALVSEDSKQRFLVDFERKSPEPSTSAKSVSETADFAVCDPVEDKAGENENEEMSDGLNYKFIDDDWLEYTDCLGRTRNCHRDDLENMQAQDKALAKTLHKEKEADVSEQNLSEKELAERELVTHDMHLELLRRKWEDKEKELLNKDNIHYEDILFDEARSHGVGYWKFSTDPEQRQAEQQMLRKIRAETEQRQKEAKALRERREQQRQSRLIAARQRQRARLGLPPIEVAEVAEQTISEENEEENEETKESETAEQLETKLQKSAHVRPWDLGKDGVQQPQVMTQEEWNEKKRSERPAEFAPAYVEDTRPKRSTRTQLNQPSYSEIIEVDDDDESMIGPLPPSNPLQSNTKNFLKRQRELREEKEAAAKRRSVEIPPPTTFDYHTPEVRRVPTIADHQSTGEAIEAGLKLLREQFERDQKAIPKGTYHTGE